MKLSLIDLHCDTLYEIFAKNKSWNDPALAVQWNSTKPQAYEKYCQVAAIWSPPSLSDEQAFAQCISILNRLREHPLSALLLDTNADHKKLRSQKSTTLLLAVEDARLLANDLQRLTLLRQKGIRFLTLLWKGFSCIGGAYDTERGLTDFGKKVVTQCAKLGVIPDISHASVKSAWEIVQAADGYPVIASHSDSFTVYPHPRNLHDSLFREIKRTDGLVGINLCMEHLGIGALKGTDTETILRHIDHFLSLDGENVICFGCDFDGAAVPTSYQHPENLYQLAEEMLRRGYSELLVQKLFWENAENFMIKNIINKDE